MYKHDREFGKIILKNVNDVGRGSFNKTKFNLRKLGNFVNLNSRNIWIEETTKTSQALVKKGMTNDKSHLDIFS
jgi:hypothetical protein